MWNLTPRMAKNPPDGVNMTALDDHTFGYIDASAEASFALLSGLAH